MKRLVMGVAVVGLMFPFLPAGVSGAASNTATTLFPLDGPNQLETHSFLNCIKADGHCDFVVGAHMRTPDGVAGFPPGLWARQTTEIRGTNRLAYMDAHGPTCDQSTSTCPPPPFERVMKSMGSEVVTTVYFGEGPPDKYQTTGRIDVTDWATGQPMTNTNVILCTHIQVVYPGVNITSPSTCAQTNFA